MGAMALFFFALLTPSVLSTSLGQTADQTVLVPEKTETADFHDESWKALMDLKCACLEDQDKVLELLGPKGASGFASRLLAILRSDKAQALTALTAELRGMGLDVSALGSEIFPTGGFQESEDNEDLSKFCEMLKEVIKKHVRSRAATPEPQMDDLRQVERLVARNSAVEWLKPMTFEELTEQQQATYKIFASDPLQHEISGIFQVALDRFTDVRSFGLELSNEDHVLCVRKSVEDRGCANRAAGPNFAWVGVGQAGQTCLVTAVGEDMVGQIRFPEKGTALTIRSLGRFGGPLLVHNVDVASNLRSVRGGTSLAGVGVIAVSYTNLDKLYELREKTPLRLEETLSAQEKIIISPSKFPSLKFFLTYIDVHFGYTPHALVVRPDMDAYIQGLLDLANNAYRDSGILARLRLHGKTALSQEAVASNDECGDRDQAKTTNEGQWDELDDIRAGASGKEFGPDIIAVLTGRSDYCGCAYIGIDGAYKGFLSLGISCATDVGGFPHEVGHLFGARHNTEKDSTNTPFAYGHGFLQNCPASSPVTLVRTVMSYRASSSGYTCSPPVSMEIMSGLFSSPSLQFNGITIGSAASENAVKVHNDRREFMSDLADDGCFPANAQFTLESGEQVAVAQLRVGDRVKTIDRDGNFVTAPILSFLDKQASQASVFISLGLSGGTSLTLSPRHLVFVGGAGTREFKEARAVPAWSVQAGQRVWQWKVVRHNGVGPASGLVLIMSEVLTVTSKQDVGLYAPLVNTGTLLVDGVAVSCYSSMLSHQLAHIATAPLRWATSFALQWPFPSWVESEKINDQQGIHWYGKLLLQFTPKFLRGLNI
eukprot:gb/GEZN01001849.1/.p1 GENE.gb/GEZN01001849.1/~~gb/GEZN01001849.1/.p1  ORF type:complete len:827 (+),score=68.65 gb/GEZN01001849.1/:37-2517(+)